MSSQLLLRLFESDFFSVHLAVSYLKTYPDSIGVTYYLVNRLAQYPEHEIEPFWPQLCHLLITRQTDSAALEGFLVAKCEQSVHLAMLTLWYLQSSLFDLSAAPSTPAFATCRRVLNRVHAIIFADPLSDTSTQPQHKIQHLPQPALVGMASIAAAIATPTLASFAGNMAREQAKRHSSHLELPHADISSSRSSSDSGHDDPPIHDDSVPSATPVKAAPPKRKSYMPGPPLPFPTTKSKTPSFPRKAPPMLLNRISQSQSMYSLSPTSALPESSDLSAPPSPDPDPPDARLSARRSTTPILSPAPSRPTHSPKSGSLSNHPNSLPRRSPSANYFSSVPSLPKSSDLVASSINLPKHQIAALLRSQACRSQLDLLTSLQDIATRLVAVPKVARLSALRAELTVLNHGLPRGCCLGMGCHGAGLASYISSDDMPATPLSPVFSPQSSTNAARAHHRIVRISPSESVVLNSADRAPFLIHVEVLEDDLDFNPDRRQNAEDVRRVINERDGITTKQSASPAWKLVPHPEEASTPTALSRKSSANFVPPQAAPARKAAGISELNESPSADITSPPPPQDEEIDLVEQVYGNFSMRALEEQSDAFPPYIQNKQVDEEAWRRSRSKSRSSSKPSISIEKLNPPPSNTFKSPSSPPSAVSINGHARKSTITLDEYAERMRMAAIMLAQLDASQQASQSLTSIASQVSVGNVVGIGVGVVGSVLGLSYGAVKGGLTYATRRDSPAPGQATTGISASLDTTSATTGLSEVSGIPHPAAITEELKSTPTSIPKASPGAQQAQRHRLLPPLEAAAIRERIMTEMMALEEERMSRMREDSQFRAGGWTSTAPKSAVEDEAEVMRAVNKEDPSGAAMKESWSEKRSRIRIASPYGHLASWDLLSVIVKTGADLRQEQLATQLIRECGRIWTEEACPHWIRFFRILVTSESTGLIETITDTLSIHSIKKEAYARMAARGELVQYSLYDYFVSTFGEPSTASYRRAQDAFMKSLASYSLICYILQIKDRHNGNILLDKEGHLMHIDFGFMLSNSPGSLGFEMAPFKLTQEYIDILGGMDSPKFNDFKSLLKRMFRELRKHAERIIMLVELMQKDSKLPCFAPAEQTAVQLRERFQLGLPAPQVDEFVDRLVLSAASSVWTRLYDQFQRATQGVL